MGDDATDETGLSKAREEHDDRVDCDDGAIVFATDTEGGVTDFPRFGVNNRTDTYDGSLRLSPGDRLKLEFTWQGTVRTAAELAFFLSPPRLEFIVARQLLCGGMNPSSKNVKTIL